MASLGRKAVELPLFANAAIESLQGSGGTRHSVSFIDCVMPKNIDCEDRRDTESVNGRNLAFHLGLV